MIKQAYADLKPRQAELILAAHMDHGVDKLKRAKNVSDSISFSPA
jgi:hypothetical protein